MDSNQADGLGSLLVEVLALPPEERADFLEAVCGEDAALRAEVESLLAAYEDAPAYFDGLAEGLALRPLPFASGEAGPVSDPHRLIDQQVGSYRVLEYLGGGGMGIVYKAEDIRLKRVVALKFLPPVLSQDARARQRFLHEAQAASALDHPNICTIYEINETAEGQFYIAMAYYEGETLNQLIERGPLVIDEALDLALQVAEGLGQAHAQGIIHRDVKPANVMITGEGRVKVLDFGLAKLIGGTQITRTGMTMGTVAYMSPEQARGEQVDHQTDIWSTGVMLYEMVAGQRPFPGEVQQAVLYGVINLEPQPVAGLRAGVPMQLAHLINKALAKERHERYQHMSELLADLRVVQQRAEARSSAARTVLAAPREDVTPASEADVPVREEVGPVKILVVDDEPELELLIRQKFRKQVRAQTWTFVFATDGREALRILETDPDIALVLTDLNMPGMDGLTLLARLAEQERVLKAVVVSAYGDLANIRTAMNRGAYDFVTKPIDFADLELTIHKTQEELKAFRKASEAQRQLVSVQKELEVARRIQEAVLPVSFPERADLDLYAFTTAAREVGGTFYDYFLIGEDKVGFVMGDVAGRGVSAALFMAMSQTFLKGLALQGGEPGACLSSMNRMLFREGFPDLNVTVFYGLLNTETGGLAYANAGHPFPYVLHADGVVAPLDAAEEVPVWTARDHAYATRQTLLQPGDGLLLFTKGVTGALNQHGHAFSRERLAVLLRKVHAAAPAQVIRAVIRGVMDFSDHAPLTDDLTVLALRYLGP